MAHIITGRRNEAHITSDDEKMRNIEAFGYGKFLFGDVGGRLWGEKVDNNHVLIHSGMCMSCGTQMGIDPPYTETVELENGLIGWKRHDLIVMHYERNTDEDTESCELRVIKGTPMQSNPEDPPYTEGYIVPIPTHADVDNEDDTPLCRVVFDGQTIVAVEPMLATRAGYVPQSVDDDVPPVFDPTNPYVITKDRIDELWNMRISDGDATPY